jgi:hypothetical protein
MISVVESMVTKSCPGWLQVSAGWQRRRGVRPPVDAVNSFRKGILPAGSFHQGISQYPNEWLQTNHPNADRSSRWIHHDHGEDCRRADSQLCILAFFWSVISTRCRTVGNLGLNCLHEYIGLGTNNWFQITFLSNHVLRRKYEWRYLPLCKRTVR